MSYSTLRKNYTRYKDRRQLCSSYDAFFSDDRILPMMPRLLGKVRGPAVAYWAVRCGGLLYGAVPCRASWRAVP